jgi:hypothetical protein
MSDIDRYKLDVEKDYDAAQESREKANEDMRFIGIDGGMWEGFLQETHNSITRRARLEFDITSDYVMRYVGEWTLNRANVLYTQDDKATTENDADLLNGVYRADFKDNDGQIAQDTAVYEVAVCGTGAFQLSTAFIDEEDPENEDQEVIWEPINNAFNHVLWDENAKRSDKADAKRCTKLTAYSHDAFKAAWPDAHPVSAFEPETLADFNWTTREVIYVAERYEVKVKKEKVQVWRNVIANEIRAFEDEKIDEEELKALGWEFVRERKIDRRTVEKTIFTGVDILEGHKRIAGKWIPIIPMYGFRTYVDNVEYYRGLVRKLKDANRTINMGISKMAESSATSGDSVPIFTRQQIKGLEGNWQNKTDKSYHVINDLVDPQGNPIASGPVGTLQPNQIDPNTISSIDIISNFVQRLTGNAPQDTIDPDASGKAINALRKRENLNTQVVTDNIVQSIKHSGVVYRAMAGDIYTRSQMKKILGVDGTIKMEQLNMQSLDPQTGNPIQINDLSKGKFSVDVEVGPQYESQKEATIESIERVMEKIQPDSPYFGPLIAMWMENIKGTGLKPLKEFNRSLMLRQGLVEPENQEEEQIVQQLQQQTDPQDELIKAATNQQNAEAKNLEASSVQKIADSGNKQADSQLKKAQAAEKVVDIGIKQTEQTLRRLVGIEVS